MSFVGDLKAIADSAKSEDATLRLQRLAGKAYATNIILGLMLAKMEQLHPGSKEEIRGQLKIMAPHIAADETSSPVVKHAFFEAAEVLLGEIDI